MQNNRGQSLAGALSRNPRANLQRVSPGVYRNTQGQLTGPGGRPMPGQMAQSQQPMSRMPLPEQQMPQMADQMTKQPLPSSQDIGQAFGQLGRQPMPQNEMPQFATNAAAQAGQQIATARPFDRPMPMGQFQPAQQVGGMLGQLQQDQGMQWQFQQMAQQYQQPQAMPQSGMPFKPMPYQRMR